MVIRHSLKKIVKRFNKYGNLFDRVNDYLTHQDQKLCGIENYLAIFRKLKLLLERMYEGKGSMRLVTAVFQKLHSARSEIDFETLDGI